MGPEASGLVNGRAAERSSKKSITSQRSLTSFFGESGIAPQPILRGLLPEAGCHAQREHGGGA